MNERKSDSPSSSDQMHDQTETVRRGYDHLSYAYRADDTPDDYGDYAEWISIVRDLVPARAPVLDIGCGCGIPATRLLARDFYVTGIDVSEVQVQRARELVPNARFLRANVMDVELPEAHFAAVISFYAIIHMPLANHQVLFRRIAGWLRPGGYMLAIVGHEAWTGVEERYLGVEGGRMAWSHADEATTLGWIAEAGLRVVWTRFVPEDDSGHTLVLARRPLKA